MILNARHLTQWKMFVCILISIPTHDRVMYSNNIRLARAYPLSKLIRK